MRVRRSFQSSCRRRPRCWRKYCVCGDGEALCAFLSQDPDTKKPASIVSFDHWTDGRTCPPLLLGDAVVDAGLGLFHFIG